jgi:hypothetical protein
VVALDNLARVDTAIAFPLLLFLILSQILGPSF